MQSPKLRFASERRPPHAAKAHHGCHPHAAEPATELVGDGTAAYPGTLSHRIRPEGQYSIALGNAPCTHIILNLVHGYSPPITRPWRSHPRIRGPMRNFIEIHLKPQTLQRYGLPDIPYPITIDDLQATLDDEKGPPFATLLYNLQKRSEYDCPHWQELEPAMGRLAELLAPEADHEILAVASENWWLELGPVNLDTPIVTVQRQNLLIAAINPTKDGRLRIATYRPLDADSASRLIGLSHNPDPEYGICHRENNWEYALDCSVGTGNLYAFEAGDAHLSIWEYGIGIYSDGTHDPKWRDMLNLTPRPAIQVMTEIGIYYTISQEDQP